ncbi:MAG: helix-turn-helix domain-containing protein [Deltaproteobacteria bacterium]|jgi:transcriptional regulator with XRE-family HTH domain
MGPEDIKRIRQCLGWSQEALAREVGVSFCTVNRWERGKSQPSPMAIRILEGFRGKNGLSNSRKMVRFALKYPLSIYKMPLGEEARLAVPDTTGFTAYTEDLSYGGLMFKTPSDIKPGDLLDISLSIGQAGTVRAVSRAIWTVERAGGRSVGVCFNEMKPEDFAKVVNNIPM